MSTKTASRKCFSQQSLQNEKGIQELNSTYGKKEITDVMGQVDGNTHVREVEPVAQDNKGQSDDMVSHKLSEVLTRLLHAQKQDNGLLCPVRSLEQVVKLEDGLVGLVQEGLVHASRVEISHWRSAHDIHARRSHECKVEGCVHLFHKL